MIEVSLERLRELLDYDPDTGVFTRKVRVSSNAPAGQRAGCQRPDGRWVLSVDDRKYLASRLAWFYVHGKWPANHIDHIDCDRANDRLDNLRDVTSQVNMQNRKRPKKNCPSGFLGVTRHRSKWQAQIGVDGKLIHLGLFPTPEAAHAAYVEAKRRLHPGCTL